MSGNCRVVIGKCYVEVARRYMLVPGLQSMLQPDAIINQNVTQQRMCTYICVLV